MAGLNRVLFKRRGCWLKLVVATPFIWLLLLVLANDYKQNQEETASYINSDEDDPLLIKMEPDLITEHAHEINPATGVLAPPVDLNGPGEMGKPVMVSMDTDPEIKKLVDKGWEDNAFNQYVSDMISVHRSLPDPRDEWCRVPGRFADKLPQTSVIICFHNEAWSALLRTVHSVLNRSPEHLIKEIILVDDYSDMAHLQQLLDDYMAQYPKVRVIRAKKREGLIRARLIGTMAATAPVLTFLDSHCECATGWLEGLLDSIAKDRTTVVCPVIEIINEYTFEYLPFPLDNVQPGGFYWDLTFDWHSIPPRENARRQHPAEPVRSPTMAGGLFAIDKAFFEKLGKYDPEFDIWGGENLELSFKVRNIDTGLCIDGVFKDENNGKPVGVFTCHGQAGPQHWALSKDGEIRHDETCLDFTGVYITMYTCNGQHNSQYWEYNPETSRILHGNDKKCLSITEVGNKLIIERCNFTQSRQRWKLENYDSSKML